MNDYGLNLLNKVAASISGLVVSIILARYLGVVARGELAFLMQAAGLAAIGLALGVNQGFPFFYKNSPEPWTFDRFAKLVLWQGAIYGALALTVGSFTQEPNLRLLMLLTVSTLLYQQFESIMAAYNIRLKIRVNLWFAVARVCAHLAMWAWAPIGLLWPVMISCALWVSAVLLYMMCVHRLSVPYQRWPFVRSVLAFGWLPMLTTLLIVLNYNVDLLMLKALGTPVDLGLYAVAAGITVYLWVVPDAIKEVLVSRVVRSHDNRAVLVPLKFALVMGILSVVGLVAVGNFAIPFAFGREYAASYPLAAILSLGVVSMIYYKLLGVVVLNEGKRKFYFVTLFAAVLLNVGLNLWAIPRHGATGAAVASVVSYSFTGVVFVLQFARANDLRMHQLVLVNRREFAEMRSIFRRENT